MMLSACPAAQAAAVLREPLRRHGLEASGVAVYPSSFLRLADLGGIGAVGKVLAGTVPPAPGFLERHVGVSAHRKALALTAEAVVEAPPLPPAGSDEQVQPPAVAKLVRPLAGLGVAGRGVGEHDGNLPSCGSVTGQIYRKLPSAVNGRCGRQCTVQALKKPAVTRVCGFCWIASELVIGGAGGDRTPDLRIANATLSQLSYGP